MSIRVTLNCQLKPGQIEILKLFLEKNLPNVRGFTGCRCVTVYFDKDDGEMLLEEEWEGVVQHQEYMKYIADKGTLEKLGSFFESPPTVKYFVKEEI